MKVDVEQVDTCVRRLMIEVPADRVGRELNTLYRDLQRRVKIPGFRPGKAPRRILEQHYGDSVKQEVIQKLVPDVLSEALTETGLNTVGQPSIDQIDLHKNEPLRFVATAQVLPDFTVNDYQGWQFERRIMAVEGVHIDRVLEGLRERHAELHTVSDRALAAGDHAIINYDGTLDGVPLEGGSGTNVTVEIGVGRLPEIEQALVGLEQGAETSIPVSFPEAHPDLSVAGKTVQFHATVVEIKEKVLPDLDDEFARAYEEEDSLEALRERVRGELEESMRQRADNAVQQEILAKLVAENPVDVPEALLHEQMRQLYLRQRRLETGQEPREEDYRVDPHSLHEVYGEPALEAVRGQVILHHIEADLGIGVTPEEVDAEVVGLASRMAQNPEALKRSMEQNGSLDAIRAHLRERKVFAALMATMQIHDTIVSEDELAAAGDPTEADAATALPEEG
jgi:trigger factor